MSTGVLGRRWNSSGLWDLSAPKSSPLGAAAIKAAPATCENRAAKNMGITPLESPEPEICPEQAGRAASTGFSSKALVLFDHMKLLRHLLTEVPCKIELSCHHPHHDYSMSIPQMEKWISPPPASLSLSLTPEEMHELVVQVMLEVLVSQGLRRLHCDSFISMGF